MAKFESLKDYLNLNRKDEILQKVNDYIQADSNAKGNCCLKDITIVNVRCVPEIEPKAMVFMDVCAEVYNKIKNNVSSAYYNISFSGNVLTGFSGLNLILAAEISERELKEEDIRAMFGLPDISRDSLEKESEKIHRVLCYRIKKAPEHKYWFPVIDIKEKYNLNMWPAILEEGILGQIHFKSSTADIYDIRNMNKCFTDEHIPANSILLNSDYYKGNGNRHDDIIVATHELIHWNQHKLYFFISQLLEDDKKPMNCTSKPITLDDSMSLKERAYWYAEWQANELAIRVAMPKHLVEMAIEEYNNDESLNNPSDIPFSGMYYQNMIYKLSWDFNVPEGTVKERLRQLGYDYADGTFVTVDDCSYQPFTFPQGTLKEDETFVIDRDNYERLLRDDKDFAELIESKICVYTGHVVCINSPKYIDYSICSKQLRYSLSEYALGHADECCLIFTSYTSYDTYKQIPLMWNSYLCCDIISNDKALRFKAEENMKVSEYRARYIERIRNDEELYGKILKAGKDEFSEIFTFIMDKEYADEESDKMPQLRKKDLAVFIGCDDKTIQNYRNGGYPDTIEKAMLVCLALETGPKVSKHLIEKSVGGLRDVGNKKIAYETLLEHTYLPLDEWNRILKNDFGLPPIRFKKQADFE